MDTFRAPIKPLRSRFYDNVVGLPLTDARIAHYQALGWYSPEIKALRREREQKRKQMRALREGNFLNTGDGRLIYNPN